MHTEEMELLEALALAELTIDASRLTLNGTTYSSLLPVKGSTQHLLSVVVNSKPPFDPNTLREYPHVTLVYSRNANIDIAPPHVADVTNRPATVEDDEIDLQSLAAEYPKVIGKVTGVDYWEGHDKDGYAVVKLDCPDAEAINSMLRMAGAKHSFDEFQAHMTICGKVGPMTPAVTEWMERINKMLASEKIELTFDRMVIEDSRKG
jgi:2'-5' RNA ligase